MDATQEPQGFPTDSVADGNDNTPALTKFTDKTNRPCGWKRTFLRYFAKDGNLTRACKIAGVSRQRVWQARQGSGRFAQAYKRAYLDSRRSKIDHAEQEAFHRAVHGWKEPVYQGGVLVGHKRKKSDTLLVRVLEAEAPRKYAKRTESRTSGANILVSVEMRAAFLGDASVRQAVCARDTADEAAPSVPVSLPHEDRPS